MLACKRRKRTSDGSAVVDAGPHPNPRKAAEGYRPRVLAVEDAPPHAIR